MDAGASSHLASDSCILHSVFNSRSNSINHVLVSDGSQVFVTAQGYAYLPNSSFLLSNTLIAPSFVKNLIFIRQFTKDNNCSIDFDAFGFSVKDVTTKTDILRCNSSGDLYIFITPSSASRLLWHQCLGHPGDSVLTILASRNFISYHKNVSRSLCNACQLGKHSRLPFSSSLSVSKTHFQLIHADLWTSHVLNFSGFKFYLVLTDYFTHLLGLFP